MSDVVKIAVKALFDADNAFRDRLYGMDANGMDFYQWIDPPDLSAIAVRLMGVPEEVQCHDAEMDWDESDYRKWETEHGPFFIWDPIMDAWYSGDWERFLNLCETLPAEYKKELSAFQKKKELLFV